MGLNCLYYGDANTSEVGFLYHLQNRLKGYYNNAQTITNTTPWPRQRFQHPYLTKSIKPDISYIISPPPYKKYNLPETQDFTGDP